MNWDDLRNLGDDMNRFVKPIQGILVIIIFALLSGCTLGQAAATDTAVTETTAPEVSISIVMTSAAATAFVQLTQIASLPSPTNLPSATLTQEPPTNTPGTPEATATLGPALQQLTPTEGAGGLPVVQTPDVQTPVPGALPTNTTAPSLTPVAPIVAPPSTGPTCLNSAFVDDVTIPDKTVLKPGVKFRKIWRIQNTGTCTWDSGFGLVNWSNAMGGLPVYYSENDQVVAPGGIVDLGVDMVAPLESGDQIGHWVMVSDTGITFGTDLTIYIVVTP